ncbi:MAG TPA: glucose-6-phosphate dehydrogenase assembly protein OpcA [Candidatus Acidoferrales bacterium]|nr:glucose-6-phosphate dehydrogenase assembly protein OpcA [Candidatus Acidoferrales bacterium]
MSLDVHPVVDALAKARQDPGSMKTATMTFAVFFGDEAGAGWVRERTRALAVKHPSRVVVFDATRGENERIVEPSRSRGEWIEIGVADASAQELGAALAMLELPEAPVVLLWVAEGLASDERFLTLARRANTTICSSSVIRTDEKPLRDLTEFVEAHPEIVLDDVAYLRLTAWQELIAEFFDDSACRSELDTMRRVEVTAGSDAEMYYLLGWLASRLSWTPLDEQTFGSHGGNVQYAMLRDGPPRRLSKVVLSSQHATFTASVHPQDQSAICLDVSGSVACAPRCAPMHTVDLASLVERAILSRGRDQIFIESLAMAKQIIERRTHDT